jgi:hypothetical protein
MNQWASWYSARKYHSIAASKDHLLAWEKILKHRFVPRQFRHHLLQTQVSRLQLPHLASLINLQTNVLRLPPVECTFADPCLPNRLHHQYAHIDLLQHPDNLFHAESFLQQQISPLSSGSVLAEDKHPDRVRNIGAALPTSLKPL